MRNGNYGTRYTEGIRNKTAISKKKKNRKWSPLTFGLDSVQFRPILSMKNRIYKKSLHRLHGLEFFVEYTKFSKIAKRIPRKKRLKSSDLNNALLRSYG